ncbi:hypothetical protein ACFSUS_03070 [Spirosoma soli]|uniref:DUF3592 domain-containing protein n=1 Tax=Spirosoma soli TaxID=1770529 RepID=A0ABW5LZ90_9BACT
MAIALLTFIRAYRGWLVALLMVGMIALPSYYMTHTFVSSEALNGAVNRDEVAKIVVVRDRLALSEEYTAEITLNSTGLKRYKRYRADVFSNTDGPHLTVEGSSQKEVNWWRNIIAKQPRIQLSYQERYNWVEAIYKLVAGGLVIVVMLSIVQRIAPVK